MLTQARLQELLDYNPETGVFRWRVRPANCVHIGDIAGRINSKGYRQININYKNYKAHRLAWLYVYGDWPLGQVDHINRLKDDNRVSNLRIATHGQNVANGKVRRHGLKGAFRAGAKWTAQIRNNGTWYYLGYFNTEQEAHSVYVEAAQQLHGEFARAA